MNMAKKILIVDDDEDVILVLSTVLQDKGYEAVHAMDGKRGLEVAKAESPELILLDLMMPQKSGISLLADLKTDAKLKKIPVIMITGVSGETGIDLESFFRKDEETGVETMPPRPDGYLEKPVDAVELISLIEEFLG
jgi:CheY-like chemotaxis protein